MNSRIAALVATTALALGLLSAPPAAEAIAATPPCGDRVFRDPIPLQDVVAGAGISRTVRDEALDVARETLTEPVRELAEDDSLWLDACADPFYVEEALPTRAATSAGLVAPLADTFTLSSRPGAAKTIYLDFLGETVTGSAWNEGYGATITAPPFSLDSTVSTSFSNAELTAIQEAWQSLAEDYAPWDVNVTTEDPGSAAILRSSSSDTAYGIRMVVTGVDGPIARTCGCGGMAYIGVFGEVTAQDAHRVAWVFSPERSSGKNVAEAAAHEAGHTLGLRHDGSATEGYHRGTQPWGPIMGAGYYQPVTQWSRGEYAGANNTEDDLGFIGVYLRRLADDHGDTATTTTPIATGSSTKGVIATAADVDAFSVDPAENLTLSATPAAFANLDIRMRVLDSAGGVLATVDPTARALTPALAAGLDATWTGTGAATVLVEGVGGPGYSDYASLGAYTLTVARNGGTTPDPDPDPVETGPLAADGAKVYPVVNRSLNVKLPATGGTGTYTWAPKPSKNWPAWLTLTPTGRLTGTPPSAATVSQVATVTDGSATVSVPVRIYPVTVPPPAAGQTLALTLPATSLRAKQPFSTQLAATGAIGTVTYKYRGLPPGLRLNAAGLLTGTPTTGGVYVAAITATAGAQSVTQPMAFNVSWPALVPAGNSLKAVALKRSTARLKVTGGTGKYLWSGKDLPAGVTLAANGTLTVLASAAGTLNGTATVSSGSEVAQVPFAITVAPPPLQWVGTTTTLTGALGRAISLTMTIAGGAAPYHWEVVGSTPAGLTVSRGADTITLSGTFSSPVNAYVTVAALDSAGKKLVRRVRVLVK